ncbi:flagellar hook-basal body complex protein [Alicyclobacillus acidoterrestris]|uniref:Flagellar hook protein FlgE n=1 Tax=Alicyclobacillus acidoterrestris (strain ATCC 49025 / DSM 3922 / CIP 106132 / NCIMB 13137 / GD3B) TaxID=1356854 RepID=T0D976_ALIAG|nr:flagellar hook-basal body complex protein [Alicyclobacillus acidoterrestris]EPZ46256.1 hypothetical protein N007_07110 [Alicyclobacillus acidoterrestris ATCC 49025]UNO47110.1 flagellar hook-basal body complex protein [Alicyclobacillus acidoterrestris]
MLRSMNSAISGMQAFQTDLDVVGNNIANVNTVGFKSSSTNFANILSQTLAGGSSGTATQGGTNPQQVGLGVKVASTAMDFSQGATDTTDIPTNVLINGNGLFVVKDASGDTYYTRAGDFSVDNNDNLVLPNGMIAQGWSSTDATSGNPTAGELTNINLKTLDSNVAANPNVQIGSDGSITVSNTDGTTSVVGYLAIANVPNQDGLEQQGDNLFSVTTASGPASYSLPGKSNAGTLQSGALEGSNVDLSSQFAEMIVAQNAYVANTHMIGTDNSILQALVNMKNS